MPDVYEYLMEQQPDWNKAPSWAKWWAVCFDGRAIWFECHPNCYDNGWYTAIGSAKTAGFFSQPWAKQVWRYTLVQRNGKLYKVPDEPDWAKAPLWANWWHVNRDGAAWWCEKQPTKLNGSHWITEGGLGRFENAGFVNDLWAKEQFMNLRQRPAMVEYQPHWEQAPGWARYCTVDAAGRVTWFQHQPEPVTNRADDRYWNAKFGQWEHEEDIEAPGQFGLDWTKMVWQRPFPRMSDYDSGKDKVTFLIDASQDHLQKIRALFVDLERETQWRDQEIQELRRELAFVLAEYAHLQRKMGEQQPDTSAEQIASQGRTIALKDEVIQALNLTILDLRHNLQGATARADASDESARIHREAREELLRQISEEDELFVLNPVDHRMYGLRLYRKMAREVKGDGAV